MKKIVLLAGILSLIAFTLHTFWLAKKGWMISKDQEIKVLIVHTSAKKNDYSHIIKAYRSVCDEEGISYEGITAHLLLALKASSIVRSHPALIFPDGASRNLPLELRAWVKDYLEEGGNVMIVYDPGTVNTKGAFQKEALFSDITGINYITYDLNGDKAYTLGNIKFANESSSAFFQVPFGKTAEGLLLGGYAYGKLDYPVAVTEYKQKIEPAEIFASVLTKDGEELPAVVMRKYGKGSVLYVNLPLGHLKCFSDDFPLRSMLRTFLFKVVKIPHLLNTPYGKGGMVINWHIDANVDWESIQSMQRDGYLIQDMEYSLHVTAGDFRDEPGDGLGFDACGKGRSSLELLKDYGVLGSHGGWAHNWFSGNIEAESFGRKDILEQIKRNNECLESIVDYKIVEYAAPNGTHPQPVTTEILAELGFLAYYYTGDTGSAPNRTFFNGQKISDRVIAFPILTFGKSASFYEMQINNYSEDEVLEWLLRTTEFVIENRTVRLIYSHPYDIPEYPQAIKAFFDNAYQKQKEGMLQINTMTHFAKFLLRFLKTDFHFQNENNTLITTLQNPEGLEGMTFALPKDRYQRPNSSSLTVEEDRDFYYCSLLSSAKKAVITVDKRL